MKIMEDGQGQWLTSPMYHKTLGLPYFEKNALNDFKFGENLE